MEAREEREVALCGAEPGHGGQERRRGRTRSRSVPAMEPGHGGQEETTAPQRPRPSPGTRNGAWPWRPGRASATAPASRAPYHRPQWSLAMEARKSRDPALVVSSMPRLPQWSLAMEARKRTADRRADRPGDDPTRNGAWPWRPGRGRPAWGSPTASQARNGAWPWRPGRGRALATRSAPAGQEARKRIAGMPTRNGAWPWRPGRADPPATASAPRPRNGAWPWRPGRGDRSPDRVTIEARGDPAMEPGHGGQEERRLRRRP